MTIERFIDFDRFLILALIGFVIIEAPVFIALIRGIRGHKLNLIIMLIGLGAIMLLLFSFSLIPLALCWLVALVMSFVYKPRKNQKPFSKTATLNPLTPESLNPSQP